MKLKPKPNMYEITYSLKKSPNQWASILSEEGKLQLDIALICANQDWQLEAVALVKSSYPNRYDLPSS